MSDFGFSLEEIHEMLDTVESTLGELQHARQSHLDMAAFPDAVILFQELHYADAFGRLSINQALRTKLTNFDASVRVADLSAALQRVKSFLREQESQFKGDISAADLITEVFDQAEGSQNPQPEPVPVWAEQWVYVRPSSRAKAIIIELSELLEEVAALAAQTNLPEEEAALTKIERAQLIVLLETSAAMLKAPMVEPGLLKKTKKTVADAASSAAKKQVEQAMASALSRAIEMISRLLQALGG